MVKSRHQIEKEEDAWLEDRVACWRGFVINHLQVIRLSSTLYQIWNFLVFLLIYYSFLTNLFTIFILYLLEPGLASDIPFNQVSKYGNIIVPLVDILFIRWRVERCAKEETTLSHIQLFKRYMVYYFAIDVIVIIVMVLDSADVELHYWKLLIYLKVFLLQEIKEEIAISVKGVKGLQTIYKAIRLLFFLFFWSFFFACVFVTIELNQLFEGGYNAQNGFLWLTSSPTLKYINLYEVFPWYVWFQYALFFVMQMVRGAGMGVPAPRSPLSMLWYCISNITMTVIFWYFTDKVLWMMKRIMEKNQLAENLISLKEMQDIKNFKKEDYNQYSRFIESVLTTPELDVVQNESKLKGMIPSILLKEFNLRTKQYFLSRFGFLRTVTRGKKKQQAFYKQLAQVIKCKLVYQGEYLFSKNQRVQKPVLYLSQMSHVMLQNEEMRYRQKLPEWSFIGTRQFFIDQKPWFDVVSMKVAAVDYLDKADFMDVLKKYRRINQFYRQKIDGILIQRESTEAIQLSCWYCSKIHQTTQYHLNQNCLTSTIKSRTELAIRSAARQLKYQLRHNRQLDPKQKRRSYPRLEVEGKRIKGLRHQGLPQCHYQKRETNYFLYNVEFLEFRRSRNGSVMSEMKIGSSESLGQYQINESMSAISH